MEEGKKDLDELIDAVKEYLETRAEIGRLQAIAKGSRMTGTLISVVILFLLASAILAFCSIAAAYALSEWIGRAYSGFLIIAGFYLFVTLLLFIYRDKWLREPVVNFLIRIIMKEEHEKED